MVDRVDAVKRLLKGIETGDPEAVSVISPAQYIQHNPQTQTGREGLAALFARLAKTSPRVNVVRAFTDGDYVFGHTEYDFSTRRIGFEVFRFEGDFAVEHWDNIQPRRGPNRSGHGMVDGPTEAVDENRTEANREQVSAFIKAVRIGGDVERLADFVSTTCYLEHDPFGEDGFDALGASLVAGTAGGLACTYQCLHRVLAAGSFVLSVSEGLGDGRTTAFYDLYRLEAGRIVEHWNTVEHVAPAEEWQHANGKF